MRFVPILRKYVGALENPWVTESLVRPVQIIWDGVMQGWPHKFTEDNDKVYRLCVQKIYDWRTQFGKAALDAVEAHWASDAKYSNPEVHKNYVESALSPRLPFMYGCVEVLDDLGTIQMTKSFLSPFILRTFASHLAALAPIENDENLYHGFVATPPFGALVLTVTAVERALHLYRSGHKEGSSKKGDLSFSDTHWGTKTVYYVESVRKVHVKKFNQIIAAARPYCGGYCRITENPTCTAADTEVMAAYEDDCAQIMVSSDIEPESDGLADEM